MYVQRTILFIAQLEPFFFFSQVPLSLLLVTLICVLIASRHDDWQRLLTGFHLLPFFPPTYPSHVLLGAKESQSIASLFLTQIANQLRLTEGRQACGNQNINQLEDTAWGGPPNWTPGLYRLTSESQAAVTALGFPLLGDNGGALMEEQPELVLLWERPVLNACFLLSLPLSHTSQGWRARRRDRGKSVSLIEGAIEARVLV